MRRHGFAGYNMKAHNASLGRRRTRMMLGRNAEVLRRLRLLADLPRDLLGVRDAIGMHAGKVPDSVLRTLAATVRKERRTA